MKTPFSLLKPRLRSAVVLLMGTLSLPQISLARPDHSSGGGGHYSGGGHYDSHYSGRGGYYGGSRGSFGLSFGYGYAGRGYYYGPRYSPYYYRGPGVAFYSTRAVVPQVYWSSYYGPATYGYYATPGYYASPGYYGGTAYYNSYSVPAGDALRCQSALAGLGYYRGPIDGDIGPGSRAAIRQYQLQRGLVVTGYVDYQLLRSLGIR